MLLDWFRQHFAAMGKKDADALALRMLTRLQGMSLVANALDDPRVVDQTVADLHAWLTDL